MGYTDPLNNTLSADKLHPVATHALQTFCRMGIPIARLEVTGVAESLSLFFT